jgi:hypothetical protein
MMGWNDVVKEVKWSVITDEKLCAYLNHGDHGLTACGSFCFVPWLLTLFHCSV